jgi:hypothetical protein
MEKSLFNIQKEYLQIAEQLQDNGGELTPELETALAINQEELTVKAGGYASVIRYLDSYIEAGKSEKERIEKLVKTAENTRDRLKETIKNAMQMYGVEKIECGLTKIGFRKSEAVEVTDESWLDDYYFDTKTTKTVSKMRIKEALKMGKTVNGAKIVQNLNLQIR